MASWAWIAACQNACQWCGICPLFPVIVQRRSCVHIHDYHTAEFDQEFYEGRDYRHYSSRNTHIDYPDLSLHIAHERSGHTRNEYSANQASSYTKYNPFFETLEPLFWGFCIFLLPFLHVPCSLALSFCCQLYSGHHYLTC